MAVLASLAFWLLGSSYWGYCYVIAVLFSISESWDPERPMADPSSFPTSVFPSALLIAVALVLGVTTSATAAEHRLGLGLHYWQSIDDLAKRIFITRSLSQRYSLNYRWTCRRLRLPYCTTP